MSTTTSPFGYIKPGVNDAADQDRWGNMLNDDLDMINDDMDIAIYSHVLAKTSAYTITVDDQNALITGDVSGGAFSVTLPSAATAGDGWRVTVKKIDGSSNSLTVVGTIDGATNYVITSQNGGATLCSNGTTWYISSSIAGTTGGVGTLPIDQGGTGATTAVGARSNLGLGTMAVQDASAIAVTGGTMSGVAITGGSLSGVAGIPVVTNSANGRIVIGAVTIQWGSQSISAGTSQTNVSFGVSFGGTPYYVGPSLLGTAASFVPPLILPPV
jgi:hypothetical protein